MKLAMVYHWWSQYPLKVWEDRENPILMAVSILRGHNQDADIFVLDCSGHENEWGDFPNALRFTVIPVSWDVPGVPIGKWHPILYRLCSRVFSVPSFISSLENEMAMFNDSDVFWITNPCPLEHNFTKFSCLARNNGVFYYPPRAPSASWFIRQWQHTMKKAMLEPQFRKIICAEYGKDILADETSYVWAACGADSPAKHCVNFLSSRENYTRLTYATPFDTKAKNIHLIGYPMMEQKTIRGNYAIWIKEFYEAMQRALPEELLGLIRGKMVPSMMMAKEFDFGNIKKLMMARRRLLPMI